MSVEAAAGEVLEYSAGVGEAPHAGTGGVVGVEHRPVERYAGGAAAEHQGVRLPGDEGPAVLGGDQEALMDGQDAVLGVVCGGRGQKADSFFA